MTAQETNVANGAETTLSGSLGVGATTINVTSSTGFPAVPFYAVIEPGSSSNREIVLVDDSTTATTFVLSAASSRGQDGTTDVSHASGVTIAMVPVAAHWTDVNDRIDALGSPVTTRGDVITGDASGDEQRLALGTTGYVLTSDGTDAVWGGDINLADSVLQRPEVKDWAETIETHAAAGATETLDLANGNVHTLGLSANCTLTVSNPPASGKAGAITIIITQDSTPRTITWPASFEWPGGTAPTLSTGSGDIDIVTAVTTDAGTTWYAMTAGQAFA